MATPDSEQPGDPAPDPAASGPTLPGHTVNALRAQGQPDQARTEFERLIQEGIDSGVDPRPPAAIFDSVRTEIRSRTPPQNSGTAGAQG
jgi:hypothetical protein